MVLRPFRVGIIPLREIIGNYNERVLELLKVFNYTLERDNRELQQSQASYQYSRNYTLERDNRELQQFRETRVYPEYYTLERDNRELQQFMLLYVGFLKLYP